MKFPCILYIICLFSFLDVLSAQEGKQVILSGERMRIVNQQAENCDCITMQPGFFGHQVWLDGERLKKPDLLELYKPMPSVLKEYKKGYNQRNVGNIILGASTIGMIGALAATSDNRFWSDNSGLEKGAIIGSFAAFIGGTILFSSGEQKVIWSYKDYAVETLNSDDTYVVIGDNMFLPNRTRLKRNQVRDIMAGYPEALKKYNRSVTSRTIGAVGMGTSFAGFVALGLIDDNASKDWDSLSSGAKIGIIGTTVGFFTGTGFLIASTVQRENSYLTMSSECDCLVSNDNLKAERPSYWAVGMNDGGLGLSYTF